MLTYKRPFLDVAHGQVCVCAWCYPGKTFQAEFPLFRDMPVSHGICDFHHWLMMLQIEFSKIAPCKN